MKINNIKSFVSTVALSLAIGMPAWAAENISLRLAWVAGGVDAPFFVAAEKGYFAEQGLNVEITDGNGSTGTIKALASGDFDIGIAGLGALAQAQQAAGADNLTAVAVLVQKDPTAVISLKGSGITKPKDLEGKRLATDAGNLEDGMIRAFADANGVDFDKIQLTIINGGGDRVALLKGDADFINGWANPDGDKVAAMHPIEPPMMFADYGVNILGSSVVVQKDYLSRKPEAVTGFVTAILKAKADVIADPEKARDAIIAARPDADPEAILQQIKDMAKYDHTTNTVGKPYGKAALPDIELTISLLEKYSGMKPGLTPADIYSDAIYGSLGM